MHLWLRRNAGSGRVSRAARTAAAMLPAAGLGLPMLLHGSLKAALHPWPCRVDLEVAKRSGTERQKWLVSRVEPFAEQPHYTMCALVVVNAACNTALPLFIDR